MRRSPGRHFRRNNGREQLLVDGLRVNKLTDDEMQKFKQRLEQIFTGAYPKKTRHLENAK